MDYTYVKKLRLILALNLIFFACETDDDIINIVNIEENKSKLIIPDIIEAVGDEAAIELTMQAAKKSFSMVF